MGGAKRAKESSNNEHEHVSNMAGWKSEQIQSWPWSWQGISIFISKLKKYQKIFIQYEVSLLAHLQSIPTKATTKPSVFQCSQISGKQFFLLLIWKTVSSQAEHEANKFQWIIAWLSRLITQTPSYYGNMEEATKEKVRYCDTSSAETARVFATGSETYPFLYSSKVATTLRGTRGTVWCNKVGECKRDKQTLHLLVKISLTVERFPAWQICVCTVCLKIPPFQSIIHLHFRLQSCWTTLWPWGEVEKRGWGRALWMDQEERHFHHETDGEKVQYSPPPLQWHPW